MAAHPEGPPEIAMVYAIGAGGERSFCPRPTQIQNIALRLRRWRDTPETCMSCVADIARSFVGGEPLCPRCREHKRTAMNGLEVLPSTTRATTASGAGFIGHAVVFNEKSVDLGGFVEIIAPSAISRTLQERIDLRALWNHNTDFPLGRLSAGTLGVAKDSRGLAVKIIPTIGFDREMDAVDSGNVTGMSFGFRTLDDEWTMDGPMPLREVTDMRVSEVSIVTFPAYPQTDVHLDRSLTSVRALSIDFALKLHQTRLAR